MDRLRFCFSEIQADALLVTHLPNVRYLCGFSGSAGVLFVERFRATLFTDSRYTFQAREEVVNAQVQIAKKGLLQAVGKALLTRRRRLRVGYSPSQVTVTQAGILKATSGGRVRWVRDGNLVERLRAVKDSEELARMRDAAALISEIFGDLIPRIKPGVEELELAAEIEYAMKQRGAAGPSFETIVASGRRTSWAHARPTSKTLKRSELVLFDQGAILRGYCSDMTRTVFLGRAPRRVRQVYEAVREALEAGKAAIRPGTTAGAVDAAARGLLIRRGLGRYFTHSTGHGLGLEVHEMPRAGRGEKFVLQEGMVLTVEPGVYIEGLGGVRIEDEVVVTATGAADLTTASRDFLEL